MHTPRGANTNIAQQGTAAVAAVASRGGEGLAPSFSTAHDPSCGLRGVATVSFFAWPALSSGARRSENGDTTTLILG